MCVGKVGYKGELYPPKAIREKLGLKKGTKVVYRVVNGRLIVERIKTLEEILKEPAKVVVGFDEMKELDKEINEMLES